MCRTQISLSGMKADPSGRRDVWHRAQRLSQAAIRIASNHDLDRVLQEVVDSARTVIDARYAALGVLSADGSQLARFVTSGMSDEERDRLGEHPIGKGILGLLIYRFRWRTGRCCIRTTPMICQTCGSSRTG